VGYCNCNSVDLKSTSKELWVTIVPALTWTFNHTMLWIPSNWLQQPAAANYQWFQPWLVH
jgi:hypothetical protein